MIAEPSRSASALSVSGFFFLFLRFGRVNAVLVSGGTGHCTASLVVVLAALVASFGVGVILKGWRRASPLFRSAWAMLSKCVATALVFCHKQLSPKERGI